MESEKQVTIRNALGLHVRPSTRIAETAARFRCDVRIVKEGQIVNAKSSIDLLTLAATAGTRITLRAEGEDAAEAVAALEKLIDSGFGEE